jgi:hypothetical protein
LFSLNTKYINKRSCPWTHKGRILDGQRERTIWLTTFAQKYWPWRYRKDSRKQKNHGENCQKQQLGYFVFDPIRENFDIVAFGIVFFGEEIQKEINNQKNIILQKKVTSVEQRPVVVARKSTLCGGKKKMG